MKTVIMAIAIIKSGTLILLRRTDPERNPYKEPWALFGGRIEGQDDVLTGLNKELKSRWNITVNIDEKLFWDEDYKPDHDQEHKRFIYLDVYASVASGEPSPANSNELLEWVEIEDLASYELNPPSRTLLKKLELI